MTKGIQLSIPKRYYRVILKSIKQTLEEDIGTGDITTEWTIPATHIISGKIIAKERGVIAGLAVACTIFKEQDRGVKFYSNIQDGDSIQSGDEVALVKGPARAVLSGERTALNFMQRMSGIATHTNILVDLVAHSKCKILDTRKTAPGLRAMDKWSVELGGGENHRSGLYDMVLIKENHVKIIGSIGHAIQRVLDKRQGKIDIEVEVRNLSELKEALTFPVNRILLDNMSLEDMREACRQVDGRVPLEASGNVTLETIIPIAETGVDYISVGALTHSVKALDISLIIDS